MLYYKVKPAYDNKVLYLCKNGRFINTGDFLVAGELYTLREWEKLTRSHVFGCSPSECIEPIEISKNNIYFFFGARFESKRVL